MAWWIVAFSQCDITVRAGPANRHSLRLPKPVILTGNADG